MSDTIERLKTASRVSSWTRSSCPVAPPTPSRVRTAIHEPQSLRFLQIGEPVAYLVLQPTSPIRSCLGFPESSPGPHLPNHYASTFNPKPRLCHSYAFFLALPISPESFIPSRRCLSFLTRALCLSLPPLPPSARLKIQRLRYDILIAVQPAKYTTR